MADLKVRVPELEFNIDSYALERGELVLYNDVATISLLLQPQKSDEDICRGIGGVPTTTKSKGDHRFVACRVAGSYMDALKLGRLLRESLDRVKSRARLPVNDVRVQVTTTKDGEPVIGIEYVL